MNKYINIINNSCIDKLTTIRKVAIPEITCKIDLLYPKKPSNYYESFDQQYHENFDFFQFFLNDHTKPEFIKIETFMSKLPNFDHVFFMKNTGYIFDDDLIILKSHKIPYEDNNIYLLNDYNSTEFKSLFQNNHYWITQLNNNIILVLYTKNLKMYMMIFNFERGNDPQLYLPYIRIEICDNTQDPIKLTTAFNKYMHVLFFDSFYGFFERLTSVSTKKNFTKFKKLHKSVDEKFDDSVKEKFNNEFKLEYVSFGMTNNISFAIVLQKESLQFPLYITSTKSYYMLLHEYFFENKHIPIDNSEQYDKKNIENKCNDINYKSMPEHFKNKINLHYTNGDLYIYPHKNDIISWFHIYFPLLFYHIIHTDLDKYLNFFLNIFVKSYNFIAGTFTHKNFLTEYTLTNSYYNYMVNMCNKLINLKILDKSYLNETNDILYDITFELPENKLQTKNKITINTLVIDKQIYDDVQKHILSNDITKIINIIFQKLTSIKILYNKEQSRDITTVIIILWELFLKKVNFYKNINLDKDHIMAKIKDEQIIDFKESNTAQLIDMYNETLLHNNTTPMFIINYYYLISYLYHFYTENNIHTITESKNKIIIDFGIYLHKFIILCKIVHELIQNSNDINEKSKRILLILPHIIIWNNDPIHVNNNLLYILNVTEGTTIDILRTHHSNIDIIYNTLNYNISMDTIDLDRYEAFNLYILKHPEIMFESINQSKININLSYFIKMNIFTIFNNENIRIVLLNYFLVKYFDIMQKKSLVFSTDKFGKEYESFIYCNLQLLLCKYSDYIYFNKTSYLDTDINHSINEKLKECYEKNKNVNNFCEYIINNQHIFAQDIFIDVLLNKHFNDIDIQYDYVKINNNTFHNIQLDKQHVLTKTFCKFTNYIVLFSEDKKILYILTNDYKMKFEMTNELKDDTMIYHITKITYNDNDVIKYEDVTAPFKYIIPRNFIYLIYMSNNVYNVTYFINPGSEPLNNLLNPIDITTSIITISINKNNLMYPNRMSLYDLNNFKSLLLNGGINNYNIIYIKPNESYNDKTYKIVNNDMADLISIKDEKFTVDRFSFFNDTKEHPIVSLNKINNDIIQQIELDYIINKDPKDEVYLKKMETFKNLLFKISKCHINPNNKERDIIDTKLIKIIEMSNDLICKMTNSINNNEINTLTNLFEKYEVLYRYLLYLKISSVCKDLLKTPNIDLCSKIKMYKEQLNTKQYKFAYGFEKIFELFFGNELTDEQYKRYNQIINSYLIYEKKSKLVNIPKHQKDAQIALSVYEYEGQIGGTSIYPLHHFMMGKGKSAVITPLLTLFFALIKKKIVYIIVPVHLKSQTIDTICTYAAIFKLDLNTNIIVISDSEIKELFLDGKFMDEEKNKNIIFLIDEIDSLIDPLKSNYNIVISKNTQINPDIIKFIKEIIVLIKNNQFNDHKKNIKNEYKTKIHNIDILMNDIETIIKQIDNGQLKENINWGIHPTKCYAIPFMNKDKPLLQSSFSSCILTLFLTFYYYINLQKNALTMNLYNYVIKNNLLEILLNIQNNRNISFDTMKNTISDAKINQHFFNIIFEKIISNIRLVDEQYNASFVDIINIKNIYKIGYSGTVNMNIPNIDVTFMEPVADDDEELNVKYAIMKSNIINTSYNDDLLDYFNKVNIQKYDALIDACGLFKNYENTYIATKLYEIIKRPIIFLNSTDEKIIFNNDIYTKYNENMTYTNPFLYYSQTHIIGIDINQDKYPNIHGLCIIDDNSVYTTVAQAIFRLRKLNMGHKIDFNIQNLGHKIDFNIQNITNPKDLYKFLKDNDTKSRKNKENSLMFQTLKSIIRKRKTTTDFKDKYKETIKYYFNNDHNPKDILKNIIGTTEFIDNELHIYNSIKSVVDNMIYNINSLDTNIQKENDKENEMTHVNVFNMHKLHNLDPSFVFNQRDYDSYKILLNEQIYMKGNILNMSVNINTHINILINVFTLKNTYYYYNTIQHNKDGWKCDYMFILYQKQLYLINGSILQYVYDKYIILNLNLYSVNYDIVNIDEDTIIFLRDLLSKSNFLKILNSKNTDETLFDSLSEDEKFVLLHIFKTYDLNSMTVCQATYYQTLVESVNKSELKQKVNDVYNRISDTYKLNTK